MDRAHDLLHGSIFTIMGTDGAARSISLPEVLAALARQDDIDFPRLQVHQRHPWFAFLVQLAALALERAQDASPWREPEPWRDAILALAGGNPDAFCLFVADVTQPAFMQPPVPEGHLADFKAGSTSPSQIDLVVAAKNHDLKLARVQAPRPEHWVFALIALQTCDGFLGAGNYGVARMNGGFGNRPCVSFGPGTTFAARFGRDVECLLEMRAACADRYGYRGDVTPLLWSLPWSGTDALPHVSLHPYFIEVCRRIRLAATQEGDFRVHHRPTRCARIDPGESAGDLGDPWTPVKRESGKPLTVSGAGFGYGLLHQLILSADYAPGVAGLLRERDGQDPWLVASALARGQGKTEGPFERHVQVPKRVRSLLAQPDARQQLMQRSEARIGDARSARLKVLKPAVCALLQGRNRDLKLDDARADAWAVAFDRAVDEEFFAALFASVGETEEQAQQAWHTWLFNRCRRLLRDAERSVPIPTGRRYRALAAGESVLFGAARRHLATAFSATEQAHA